MLRENCEGSLLEATKKLKIITKGKDSLIQNGKKTYFNSGNIQGCFITIYLELTFYCTYLQ